MDETKTQKMVMDSLKDKMTNGSYGTAEKEVEFQLTMTDGVWTLSSRTTPSSMPSPAVSCPQAPPLLG